MCGVVVRGLDTTKAADLVGDAADGGVGDADPEFLLDAFLYLLEYLYLLLGLQAFGLLVEYLNLLDLVVCDLEFVLEVAVLVLEHLGVLEDALGLHLVLLLVDLLPQPRLLRRQTLDAPLQLLHFLLLHLQLLLELQLSVEQFLVQPPHPVRRPLRRIHVRRLRLLQGCDPAVELLDHLRVTLLLEQDEVLETEEGVVGGLEVGLGELRVLGEGVVGVGESALEEGEVPGEVSLDHLHDVYEFELLCLDCDLAHLEYTKKYYRVRTA